MSPSTGHIGLAIPFLVARSFNFQPEPGIGRDAAIVRAVVSIQPKRPFARLLKPAARRVAIALIALEGRMNGLKSSPATKYFQQLA